MTQQKSRPAAVGTSRARTSGGKRHLDDAATAADADAVALCAAGDQHSLERLYARHGGTCLAVARQVLVDAQYAEDAVQEAFLYLWRNAASFDPTRSSPRTYLVMVTRARAVDRVRSEERRSTCLLSADEDRADDRPGPEAQAVLAALGREAVVALAALTVAQREALVLAYWGGYTQREISALTATPLGTVKTRTRAALAELSESLVS